MYDSRHDTIARICEKHRETSGDCVAMPWPQLTSNRLCANAHGCLRNAILSCQTECLPPHFIVTAGAKRHHPCARVLSWSSGDCQKCRISLRAIAWVDELLGSGMPPHEVANHCGGSLPLYVPMGSGSESGAARRTRRAPEGPRGQRLRRRSHGFVQC